MAHLSPNSAVPHDHYLTTNVSLRFVRDGKTTFNLHDSVSLSYHVLLMFLVVSKRLLLFCPRSRLVQLLKSILDYSQYGYLFKRGSAERPLVSASPSLNRQTAHAELTTPTLWNMATKQGLYWHGKKEQQQQQQHWRESNKNNNSDSSGGHNYQQRVLILLWSTSSCQMASFYISTERQAAIAVVSIATPVPQQSPLRVMLIGYIVTLYGAEAHTNV